MQAKAKRVTGGPSDDTSTLKDSENPDVIAIETLLNMQTVASLNIEQTKRKEYFNVLRGRQSHATKAAFIQGSTGGIAQFFQFWGLSL